MSILQALQYRWNEQVNIYGTHESTLELNIQEYADLEVELGLPSPRPYLIICAAPVTNVRITINPAVSNIGTRSLSFLPQGRRPYAVTNPDYSAGGDLTTRSAFMAPAAPTCECGAHAVDARSSLHSTWCGLYGKA